MKRFSNILFVAHPGADDTEALVKACNDTQSDLLVMGAYSRSRLRQRFFGGVTEYMLHQAKIPVLMLHT
jgi:nucleotide-binding universal stress UspA family protein